MIISPYLLAIVIAWITAQGAKYIVKSIKEKSFKHVRQLYLSGNMPSAHSASVVSLLVTVGWLNGADTAIFAVAALFAAIVMYDAVMVRRSSGEQGAALQALLKEQGSRIPRPRAAKGHTPIEVAAGAVLGLMVGGIVSAISISGYL